MRQILKEAIARDGRSIYVLTREAGIAHQVLSRYLNGERDVRSESLDKVLEVLDLEVTLTRKKGGRS